MDSIWDDFFNWGVPEGQNFSDHLWLKQLNDKSTTYDFLKSIFFRHQRSRSQFWQIKRWGTSEFQFTQLNNFETLICLHVNVDLLWQHLTFNDNIIFKKWKMGRVGSTILKLWFDNIIIWRKQWKIGGVCSKTAPKL